jgi:phosphoribosylanthranilate isomerase
VKICGVTRPDDARSAVEAGADYLGVVFAESPRRVDPDGARRLVTAAPGAAWVGVFRGWDRNRVLDTARDVGLRIVQLHGDEEPTVARDLASAGLEVWQAVGVDDPPDWDAVERRMRDLKEVADLILLDRRTARGMGGGGVPFAWRSAPSWLALRLARSRFGISGGLSAANVAAALACLPATLVDASSGLESARGQKDPDRVRGFVRAARDATPTSRSGGPA